MKNKFLQSLFVFSIPANNIPRDIKGMCRVPFRCQLWHSWEIIFDVLKCNESKYHVLSLLVSFSPAILSPNNSNRHLKFVCWMLCSTFKQQLPWYVKRIFLHLLPKFTLKIYRFEAEWRSWEWREDFFNWNSMKIHLENAYVYTNILQGFKRRRSLIFQRESRESFMIFCGF